MRPAGLVAALALLALPAPGYPPAKGTPVPLRDLVPSYVRTTGRLLRSRTATRPGLYVAGERHRGLSWLAPGRATFELMGAFSRFDVSVGVLDGSKAPLRFLVLGDAKPLTATPPLFPGQQPVPLAVSVKGVWNLELVALGGGGSTCAWIDGVLTGVPGADLGRFLAHEAAFSPEVYPASFKRRVNRAIDRAAAWLLTQQREDATWGGGRHRAGVTALVSLALLKAGVPRTDPGLMRAFEFLRAQPLDHTYTVALLLMALEARWFPLGADPKRAKQTIPETDMDWIRRAADWLAAQQGAGYRKGIRPLHPVWRYPAGGYDLSNTQYALFGLSAARRCGVDHPAVWLPALRFILGAQEKTGPEVEVSRYKKERNYLHRRTERARARGFGYTLSSAPTGSMTTAGVCCLVLARAALERNAAFRRKFKRATREAVRDGLAWLEEYYDVGANPFRGAVWYHYYLFNLERVGVLLDQRFIGTRDWYREGAEKLMAAQGPGGALANGPINTSFALLFLKRATVAPLTQGGR